MIFIKGIPSATKCKFSKKLVNALNELNVNYSSIDILNEPKLRWWLKFFSKCKTYP